MLFSPSSSFSYPTEAITFSSDYNTMYFTKFSKAGGSEKIYRANFNDGEWSLDSDPLSFCSDKSTYTHPALSVDGKLLIFASNRSGSIGGMDLFASLLKDGKWSDPVNLGDAVNSSFNELYPYLDSGNNLFFSSDNSQGYGGYDIYVCKYKSNTWEKPINLSIPVNTRNDDVAFKISRKDGKSAFYTVKQNAGKGSLELFKVAMSNSMPDTLLTLSQFFTRPDISQMVILALEPAVQATDVISQTADSKISGSDVVTYRVQFMTSFNPRTRSQITVNGNDYSVFEYLYSGAYRLCVGEFRTLAPALELQNLLMKNDYPQAFVVVFKNNVISLDPELLKERTGPGNTTQQTTINKPVAGDKPSNAVAGNITKDAQQPEVKKTETTTTIKNTPPVAKAQNAVAVKATIPEPQTKNNETVKAPITKPAEKKDIVIYRVQILSENKSKGSYNLSINNKNYKTFEYFYVGAYRTCVGEFSTLAPAKELQSTCRKSGHPQAFVVAFVNNKRSTDSALFK